MRLSFHRLCVLVVVAMAYTSPLLCWETDTHYGLTKWLGAKAGFSLQDAEAIALAAQGPDEGQLYPAPFAVARYTCLGRDAQASHFIQEHHFPSYGPVPGQPKDRTVVPGQQDNAANVWVRKEIATGFADVPRREALRSFGTPLHPLQDSWSHQGVSDIPPWPCTDQLSWGHPEQRGGWRSHNADLTYLHVNDTLAMASRVYELMVEYLGHHPSLRGRPPVPWTQLQPKIREFGEASTKAAKRKWFDSDPDVPLSSYTYKGFLDHINLPDGGHTFTSMQSPLPLGRVLEVAQATPPNCVQDFVEAFLMQWILEQKIEVYLQFVDIPSVANRLTAGKGSIQAEPRLWVATAFSMWLLQDHGLVNQLDHGLPIQVEGRAEGFRRLSEILQNRERYPTMRFESLQQAIRAPGTVAPYLLVWVPLQEGQSFSRQNQRYAALFQFRHTPHDALALTVERRNGKWLVIGLDWFTE